MFLFLHLFSFTSHFFPSLLSLALCPSAALLDAQPLPAPACPLGVKRGSKSPGLGLERTGHLTLLVGSLHVCWTRTHTPLGAWGCQQGSSLDPALQLHVCGSWAIASPLSIWFPSLWKGKLFYKIEVPFSWITVRPGWVSTCEVLRAAATWWELSK